jgi:hypothetical protein
MGYGSRIPVTPEEDAHFREWFEAQGRQHGAKGCRAFAEALAKCTCPPESPDLTPVQTALDRRG